MTWPEYIVIGSFTASIGIAVFGAPGIRAWDRADLILFALMLLFSALWLGYPLITDDPAPHWFIATCGIGIAASLTVFVIRSLHWLARTRRELDALETRLRIHLAGFDAPTATNTLPPAGAIDDVPRLLPAIPKADEKERQRRRWHLRG